MPVTDGVAPAIYQERLHVPLRWWVQATMFLATVWLAFTVAMPAWMAATASLALFALVFGIFLWMGSAVVEVRDGTLHAGPASIPLAQLGYAEALDKETTRLVHGVDADARAFLVTRPYIGRSVKVAVDDPRDPTPYWLISSRHPRQLAAALGGDRQGGSHGAGTSGH